MNTKNGDVKVSGVNHKHGNNSQVQGTTISSTILQYYFMGLHNVCYYIIIYNYVHIHCAIWTLTCLISRYPSFYKLPLSLYINQYFFYSDSLRNIGTVLDSLVEVA